MKYLFTTLLLLIGCVMRTWGQSIEDFDYSRRETSLSIIINKYNNNEEIVKIPSSATLDNKQYTVTTIKGLTASYDRNIEELYIPGTIKDFTGPVTNTSKNKDLKTIVLEKGDFGIASGITPFVVGSNYSKLNNFIVLDKCTKTTKELFGDVTSSFKPGEITIEFNSGLKTVVQMYFVSSSSNKNDRTAFTQERFNYLLNGLEQFGTDLSDIKMIDLSHMSTPSQTVTFDITDTSRVPNAVVATRLETIEDMKDYNSPSQDLSTVVKYFRANTQEWNSVCLPFPIKESDFLGDTRIYQMTSATDASINLTRLEEGKVLPAGTPCFIYSDQDSWNLAINCTIPANVGPKTVQNGGWQLIGSFTNYSLGTGKYKLNSAGNAFVQTITSSTVTAFRCYLQPTSSNAPARLSINIDEEASITLVPNDGEPQQVKLYDLMGRERKAGEPGIFLRARTY